MKKNKVAGIMAGCLLTLLLLTAGCEKQTGPEYSFLRYNKAVAHITNKQGSFNTFLVESDLRWQLTVTPASAAWMKLDKYEGNGNQLITVTALEDNRTGDYLFATVTAISVDNPALLPVQLTVVQYDSTYKGK